MVAAGRRTASAGLVVATGADGKVYFDGPLTNGTTSFDAVPGALKIQRTVLDADGAPKDREEVSIDVPDFASAPLAIGSPGLLQGAQRAGAAAAARHDRRHAVRGEGLQRTDHLLVRFSIVGTAADGATITANLLSRRGASLAALPFTPIAGQNGLYKSICRWDRSRAASI